MLYGTTNKSRSYEVKYNLKEYINIDKASNTFQKEFKSEELDENEKELDVNLYLKHFSDTTEFSDNTQNTQTEKNESNNNVSKPLRSKGNKSFKGKIQLVVISHLIQKQ